MILTLEGPDCSGKTTVFNALREKHPDLGVYVPSVPVPAALKPFMAQLELRQDLLWQFLHIPDRLYICDRHVSVSAPVYAAVHGRTFLCDTLHWLPYVHIVYFDLPGHELRRRMLVRGDDSVDSSMLAVIQRQYEYVLGEYEGLLRLWADRPVDELVATVVRYVKEKLCPK